MAARSWFYPDGFHPRKASFPPKWDANADPYPALVQHNGRVYARTSRWEGGRLAPDVEVDGQGFRTWTLWTSAQQKHRWQRSIVALHQALIKPVQPPKQDTIQDPPAYSGGGGSSAHYFAEQQGDYFALIEDADDIPTPGGIFTGDEEGWLTYKDASFVVDDAFTYLGPTYISDSPRWTEFHNEDDTVKMQTFTLCDSNGQNCVDVEVPAVPGFFKDQFPSGADYINFQPGSDAELLVMGYSNYVLGTQGTRPKVNSPPDLEVTFTKRILVASRHFVGREFTGYIVVARQQQYWVGNATLPPIVYPDGSTGQQVPDEVQGHFDFYTPGISALNVEYEDKPGQYKATPVEAIPFTFETFPVTYTVKNEDWIFSPEYRPPDEDDEVTINIPQAIDEGVFIYQNIVLFSASPPSSF